MSKLIEVKYDPFSEEEDLEEVDFDPFKETDEDEDEDRGGDIIAGGDADVEETPEPAKPELFGPKAPEGVEEIPEAAPAPEAKPTTKLPPSLQTEVDRLEKSQSAAVRIPKKMLQSAGQYVADIFRAAEGLAEQREAGQDVSAMEAISDRAPKDRFSFEYREYVKKYGEVPERKDRDNLQANVADDVAEVKDYARKFHADHDRMPTNKEIRDIRTLAYDKEIKRNIENARKVYEAFPEVDQETSGFLEDTLVGVSRFIPHMFLTAVTGGTASFPVLLASLTGDEYTKFKDEGLDVKKAWKYGTMSALGQAVLEQGGTIFQLGKMGQFFKGTDKALWNRAIRMLTQVSASEGTEEGLQTVSSRFFLELAKADGDIATATKVTSKWAASEEGLKEIGLSVAGGAVGGLMLGGGPIAVRTVKDIAAPSPQQQLLKENLLVEKEDFSTVKESIADGTAERVEPGQLSTDTNTEGVAIARQEQETIKERTEAVQEINRQRVEQVKQQEADRQKAAEQKQIAEAKQRDVARSQQRDSFIQKVSTQEGVMEEAAKLDAKPINEAHKALSIGEDSIQKLKGLEYDLKNDKELKEQPFEYQTTADALSEHVRTRINRLEDAEAAEKYIDENRKFQDRQIAEEEQAAKEAEADLKKTEAAAKMKVPLPLRKFPHQPWVICSQSLKRRKRFQPMLKRLSLLKSQRFHPRKSPQKSSG